MVKLCFQIVRVIYIPSLKVTLKLGAKVSPTWTCLGYEHGLALGAGVTQQAAFPLLVHVFAQHQAQCWPNLELRPQHRRVKFLLTWVCWCKNAVFWVSERQKLLISIALLPWGNLACSWWLQHKGAQKWGCRRTVCCRESARFEKSTSLRGDFVILMKFTEWKCVSMTLEMSKQNKAFPWVFAVRFPAYTMGCGNYFCLVLILAKFFKISLNRGNDACGFFIGGV